MFAPVGYTPLNLLWNQFLGSRIDYIYQAAAEYYGQEDFRPESIRGSPLDIAEHVFLNIMWACEPHAALENGQVVRVFSSFQDGSPGLFTKTNPYESAWCIAAANLEKVPENEILDVAGELFEAWIPEPESGDEWVKHYPPLSLGQSASIAAPLDFLRFHTLPIGFCRERFTIVARLPFWAKFVSGTQEIDYLVQNLGGRPLCVADSKLIGWQGILDGKTPILDRDFERLTKQVSKSGRPKILQDVIDAYQKAYSSGHNCAMKQAIRTVETQLGRRVSETTLRRAIASIRSAKSDQG